MIQLIHPKKSRLTSHHRSAQGRKDWEALAMVFNNSWDCSVLSEQAEPFGDLSIAAFASPMLSAGQLQVS